MSRSLMGNVCHRGTEFTEDSRFVGAAPQAAKGLPPRPIAAWGRSYRRMSVSHFIVGAGHARDVAKINRKDAYLLPIDLRASVCSASLWRNEWLRVLQGFTGGFHHE